MFFDMYDNQAEDLAAIIKEVAIEDKKDDASNHSGAAIRDKVIALKRRGTLKKDQLPNIQTAINGKDDAFLKSP